MTTIVRPARLMLVMLFALCAGLAVAARQGQVTPGAPPPVLGPSLGTPDVQQVGGAGHQRALSVSAANQTVAIGTEDGQLIRFSIPLGAALSRTQVSGATLRGLTTLGTEVIAAGYAIPPACGASDTVGGVENKSALARVDGSSGALLGCASATMMAYSGHESFAAVATSAGDIYGAGGAETCGFGHYNLVVTKFAANGTRLRSVSDPGVDFNGFSCIGASTVYGIVAANGSLFSVGFSKLSSEDGVYRPFIEKRDSGSMTRAWKQRPSDVEGEFRAATMYGADIVAVGSAVVGGQTVFLLERYNDAGTRIWSTTSAGVAEGQLHGVVAVGTRLFAVGTTSTLTSGGTDANVIEIDPATGATLATTLWGGALDDGANAVTTDGNDLFVAGETRSFASSDGNALGENDGVLLHYPLAAPATDVTLNTVPSGLSLIVDGSAVTTPVVQQWAVNSSHTVSAPTPQPSGTGSRFAFSTWSDGGAATHTITTPSSPMTLEATYREQHSLTTSVAPPGSGTITATPAAPAGYYDAGTQISIGASPAPGYRFDYYTGALTGTTTPQVLVMNAPQTVTANFAACSLTLSPSSVSVPPGTSSVTLAVTTGAGCYWTVASQVSWVTISSAASGTGPGKVALSIASNSSGSSRSGTVTVAGVTLSISQPACSYAVNPTSASFPASGGSATANVATATGCGWTARSNSSWLAIASGTSGTGAGTVRFVASPNTGAARSGSVTVAGRTIAVTQAAALPDACGATDVSTITTVTRTPFMGVPPLWNLVQQDVTIRNRSAQAIPGPVQLIMDGLPRFASGVCQYGCGLVTIPAITHCQSPAGSTLVPFTTGALGPNQATTLRLLFAPSSGNWNQNFAYTTRVVSGTPNK